MDCLDGKKWKDVVGYEGLYSVSDCGDAVKLFKKSRGVGEMWTRSDVKC